MHQCIEVLGAAASEVPVKEMLLLEVFVEGINLTFTKVNHLQQQQKGLGSLMTLYSDDPMNGCTKTMISKPFFMGATMRGLVSGTLVDHTAALMLHPPLPAGYDD